MKYHQQLKYLERNHRKEDVKEVLHNVSKIVAWRWVFERLSDPDKGTWVEAREVDVDVFRPGKNPIRLRECNDGSRFTSVNQAVNQAKEYIDVCDKYGWD